MHMWLAYSGAAPLVHVLVVARRNAHTTGRRFTDDEDLSRECDEIFTVISVAICNL